jgi:ribosome-binding protein aMBF1 (putative translation factor)
VNRGYQRRSIAVIKNDRQYAITKREAGKFQEAVAAVLEKAATETDGQEREWLRIHEAALKSQLGTLERELAEYDALRSGEPVVVHLETIDHLPQAFVKARIAAGLSQADLAARLGITEEELQRHESHDYQTVSVGDLMHVAGILGIEISGNLRLAGAHAHAAD